MYPLTEAGRGCADDWFHLRCVFCRDAAVLYATIAFTLVWGFRKLEERGLSFLKPAAAGRLTSFA
jgi:hypothetical protein